VIARDPVERADRVTAPATADLRTGRFMPSLASGVAMSSRLPVSLGTAIATFLAVTALLTRLLLARIAFSAIVAIPIGLVAGAVIGWLTLTRFWADRESRPALVGGAVIGYALLGMFLVGYSVPAARGLLSLRAGVGLAGLAGVVAFLVAARDPDRFGG